MTKPAPEWVRTSDPVIRSPARYRWTTAPAQHVLSPFVKDITEYSLTNFRSGTLSLSKLACCFAYIPACVVVAMQRHQIIYYDVTYSQ